MKRSGEFNNLFDKQKMNKYNLYFGLLLFVCFLCSGFYLEEYFKPQNIQNLTLRMEIRANHIYILFVSLLNVLSFKCDLSKGKLTPFFEFAFRIMLILSGIVAIYAFMYNHHGNLLKRDWTLLSVVLSLSSIAIFLTNELICIFVKKSETNRQQDFPK
ncbi:MAG: hypothetical protein C4K58_01955 [Flavobacteriaceae bacterium]|nr:MAG: hypothetical protein C4K58_01955 [Flavobacteriaceae bacterium]